jgi:hypothetical protein
MNERTKLGLAVLEAGLIVGILGDALLRATPWGVNVPLCMAALMIGLGLLSHRWRRVKLFSGEGRWLCGALVFFALSFAWRDSPTLRSLDGLALILTLSLTGLHLRGSRINLAGITDYLLGGAVAGINASFSVFEVLLADIAWRDLPHKDLLKRGAAVARGLVIAIPLLLIFGALLVSADLMFQNLVNSLHINMGLLTGHIFLTLLISWLAAGFLRGVVDGGQISSAKCGFTKLFAPAQNQSAVTPVNANDAPGSTQPVNYPSLGITEIGVVLGSLNALFLAFVLVQARYFFGGAAVVHATTGLTFAEYARRGFFELVTVALLALPLLLAAHWLLRKENKSVERTFRLLALTLIVLLFVMMGSAFARMLIYQREYGLTELRLYTTAFMGWLALVFIWFVVTVLRGQRQRFAWGTLAAALFVMTTLHALNPDSFIVRINLTHAQRAKRTFDACYNSTLSADAVPDLVAAIPAMDAGERSVVAYQLLQNWSPAGRADWRTWNLSRWAARKAVRENNARLWEQALSPAPIGDRCSNSDLGFD